LDFYVIADEDTVVGFRYAGVRGVTVSSPEQAAAELDRLVAQKAELIIITTERIAETVRDKIQAARFSEELPLIVEIPGPSGPAPDAPSLLDRIRGAVGIKF